MCTALAVLERRSVCSPRIQSALAIGSRIFLRSAGLASEYAVPKMISICHFLELFLEDRAASVVRLVAAVHHSSSITVGAFVFCGVVLVCGYSLVRCSPAHTPQVVLFLQIISLLRYALWP